MNKILLSLSTIVLSPVISTGLHAETPRYVPGEIIVKFKPGVTPENFLSNKNFKFNGLSTKRAIHLSYDHLSVLSVSNEKSLESTLEALRKNPNVVYAEPNFIYSVNPIRTGKVYSHKALMKSPFGDFSSATPDYSLNKNLYAHKIHLKKSTSSYC